MVRYVLFHLHEDGETRETVEYVGPDLVANVGVDELTYLISALIFGRIADEQLIHRHQSYEPVIVSDTEEGAEICLVSDAYIAIMDEFEDLCGTCHGVLELIHRSSRN
ncbi:MAG: hypothetical protein NTV39_04510 [Candidatus Saccharibacteria bacterium]|nr:hypothetical protein [Candidatus Saccharibacteria bacterium]